MGFLTASTPTPPVVTKWGRHKIQMVCGRPVSNHTLRIHAGICRSTAASGASPNVEDLPLPEGSMGLPLIGESIGIFRDGEFGAKRIEKYGLIFKTHLFGQPTIHINGLENIQKVMLRTPPIVYNSPVPTVLALLGEHSLTAMDGPEHALARKLVGRAFSAVAVSKYIPAIVNRAGSYLGKWAEEDCVLLAKEAKAFAFGITTESVVGIESEDYSEEELLDVFNTWWGGIASLGVNLPFTKFRKGLKARETLIKTIAKCSASLQDIKADKRALYLMANAQEEGQSLTNEQLYDVILNILVAGYDTTACALDILVLELAKNQEVLLKVRREQADVMSKFGSELTPESLAAMLFTEACVKEAIRVKPIAPYLIRKASETFEVGGYRVPKGWQVFIGSGVTALHADERWPSDTTYQPDRFLTDAGKEKGGYIPFGMGSHLCLGNVLAVVVLKVMLALLARDYVFEVQNLDPKLAAFPIPEPVDGLPVKFRRMAA